MLNVLLSFTQFEREVTAGRIRDKIAAWKRKGMWMGGIVPLGYRVENRKLLVDEQEAVIVRWPAKVSKSGRRETALSKRCLANRGNPRNLRHYSRAIFRMKYHTKNNGLVAGPEDAWKASKISWLGIGGTTRHSNLFQCFSMFLSHLQHCIHPMNASPTLTRSEGMIVAVFQSHIGRSR